MIEVNRLTKRYFDVNAIKDISFEVKKGEIVGFLGPNGAGKTTTMKILTCYMPPTSGRAVIDGLDCEKDSLKVRERIGYLPENAPLYLDMNVLEHLYFIAEVRHIPKGLRKDRIKGVVESCGLKGVTMKDVCELSKGYRQRLSLAISIIHDPDILILDEPTSGLDPNQIAEIRGLIKKLGRHKTVILSTHILSEVHATCSRVLIINEGTIVANGTPGELQEGAKGEEKVFIKLDADPEKAMPLLRGIANVSDVRQDGKEDGNITGYTVRSKKGTDIRKQIFTTAVENSWVIYEMKKEVVSLEEIFRKLTTH